MIANWSAIHFQFSLGVAIGSSGASPNQARIAFIHSVIVCTKLLPLEQVGENHQQHDNHQDSYE